jgi:hypothetical protein
MSRRLPLAILAGSVLLIAACAAPPTAPGEWTFPPATPTARDSASPTPPAAIARLATMYRSPTCDCCGEYAAYLESAGWTVQIEETDETTRIKQERGIPQSAWSCHTMVVGEYAVEGHVPIAAIEDLLAQRPRIDGIALPGMPAGSPGMPGVKQGDFVVVAIEAGTVTEFGRY